MMTRFKIFLFWAVSIFLLFISFYGSQTNAELETSVENKIKQALTLTDEPIEDFQGDLLDLAINTATAIPIRPHIKDRSLAQEGVVKVCLSLDQPQRAVKYIEKIDNWRRGSSYGDLAFYLAQKGAIGEVNQYLNLADQLAQATEGWRRDRIRIKLAQTQVLLGETVRAEQIEKKAEESEVGKVTQVKMMIADPDAFDEQMNKLDDLMAAGHFDINKNALEAYAKLFNRFYKDEQKRSTVEEKIKSSWRKMPGFIRVELLMDMIKSALEHDDQVKALKLVNEAQLFVDGGQWRLENQIAIKADLLKLRFQAGDKEKARSQADEAFAFYESNRDKIVNIYRAEALRPLAEAYQTMGDEAAALKLYKKAVEEGFINQNSRPRAEDLSATCSSMALYGVNPDPALWKRISQIYEGLGDPW